MSDGWPEECFHPLTLVEFLYSVIERERTLSFLGLQFDWKSARNCGFNLGSLAYTGRKLLVLQETLRH